MFKTLLERTRIFPHAPYQIFAAVWYGEYQGVVQAVPHRGTESTTPWYSNQSHIAHWRTCLPSIVHTLKRNEEQGIFWVKAKEETEKGGDTKQVSAYKEKNRRTS